MIGLIKLTAPDGSDFYLNPNSISFLAPNGPGFCKSLGLNPELANGKGCCIMASGVPLQFQETPNHIINALTRLRRWAEKNAIKIRKDAERSPWEENGNDDGES